MDRHKRKRRGRRIFILMGLVILVVGGFLAQNAWIRFTHPLKYEAQILQISKKNDLDPVMVAAVINVESKFDPKAQSHRGAKGLMQLLDDTALWGATHMGMTGFTCDRLYDPSTNIEIGCWYLGRLNTQFNGNWKLILAAYNGGSGNVRKWLNDPLISPDGKSLTDIPFQETEAYVEKVLKQYTVYKKLYGDRLKTQNP